MQDSTLVVKSIADLQSDQVNFNGQGVFDVCIADETKSIDLTLTDAHFLTGGELIVKGAKADDKVCLQVIHPIAGLLHQFITDFRMRTDTENQSGFNLPYTAKLPADLIIRAVYKATSEVGERKISINYMLHKIKIA